MKSQGALSYIGFVSEADVSKFVQALSAIYLQCISHTINRNEVWGYYIAFDAGSNQGDSYVDVRVRF